MTKQIQLAEEHIPADEAKYVDSLCSRLEDKVVSDAAGGSMRRDVHVKMHCLVKAEFIIEPNLPETFRIGVFAEPRIYQAWIRFSNSDGSIQADKRPDIRGMAIKLMDVPGEKLLEGEQHAQTQDFLLISAPIFPAGTVKKFDQIAAAVLGGLFAKVLFFLTNPRAVWILLTTMKKCANPLQVRYFSATPYLFGTRAVKYAATPLFTTVDQIPQAPSDDFLRLAIVDQLKNGEAVFDFSVQLQADAEAMPIEDPRIQWSEDRSPFLKVATIRVMQQACDNRRLTELGENMSFTPWNSLPAHRPLGGINRARKVVYEAISKLRHEHNREPRREPVDWDGL